MAAVNQNTPYGLSPVQRLDGAVWRDSLRKYYVPAAQTSAIFVGDAVVKLTASADVNGDLGVGLASAGGAITGVVCGFLGTCPSGAANPSFFGLSAQPGPSYRPAATSLDYYVLINDDPEAEFYIQENDNYGGVANTPLPPAAVGKNANLVLAAGSPYTGLSGAMLDANTVAVTATLQLSIKGLVGPPAGVPGALYGKVRVAIANHTETPHQAGV
jgi:hypothetical protein